MYKTVAICLTVILCVWMPLAFMNSGSPSIRDGIVSQLTLSEVQARWQHEQDLKLQEQIDKLLEGGKLELDITPQNFPSSKLMVEK